MNTLIFINHGMGDVIMGLPAVRAALAQQSNQVLALVKSENEGKLLDFCCNSKRLRWLAIRIPRESSLNRLYRIGREILCFKPDSSLLTAGINPMRAGLLSLLSGARCRVGPVEGPNFLFTHKVSRAYREHKVLYNSRVAEAVGLRAETSIRIDIPKHSIENTRKRFLQRKEGRWIGISLGSGIFESHKRLPIHVARELVNLLAEEGLSEQLILIGTDIERSLNNKIRGLPNFKGVDLTGKTTLTETLAVLSSCDALISTCNGVIHLAASVGCPIVGLYGPTDPVVTGPFKVPFELVCRELSCSPCYKKGYIRGCDNPDCMNLDPQDILDKVKSLLSKDFPVESGPK